jgi:DUF971 family protein
MYRPLLGLGTPSMNAPAKIDLKKDRGLTIEWSDGSTSYYSIAYLRRMSPSAEMKQLREEQSKNPLAILPASALKACSGPLTAVNAEMVGNYALRITFSDGHDTGIYSWGYLREIDPVNKETKSAEPDSHR